MTPIKNCILNKNSKTNPIWIMRQAGRYLPEFRKIREKNKDFINLCLNKNIVPEITLQPLKRFNFDAAIIFSDILMIPYGLGQSVSFSKGFGPRLNNIDINSMSKIKSEKFTNKLIPIYESIKITSKNTLLKNKDLIGFVGGPWTLLVYMNYKMSPGEENPSFFNNEFFKEKYLIDKLFKIIINYVKIHITHQVKSGATIIQVFDSWAGLLEEKYREKYCYEPTIEIIKHIKSLGVPAICFPRGIKNYKEFVRNVKPDAISIDYEVNPKKILNEIDIPIQGGMDPKILLGDKSDLKKEANKYLEIFKDHPYIFNLGHGILPETKIEMVNELINIVKEFK
tara:strand:- start:715 stop:1731 length:1017 start_codon:yes stop_codon:yes gene_type:complete